MLTSTAFCYLNNFDQQPRVHRERFGDASTKRYHHDNASTPTHKAHQIRELRKLLRSAASCLRINHSVQMFGPLPETLELMELNCSTPTSAPRGITYIQNFVVLAQISMMWSKLLTRALCCSTRRLGLGLR